MTPGKIDTIYPKTLETSRIVFCWGFISLAQIDLSLPIFSVVTSIFIWTGSRKIPNNINFGVGLKTDFWG